MPRAPLRALFQTPPRALLAPGLALVLALAAYRPLWVSAFGVPESYEVERWFFAPDEKTPLFFLAAAAWLLGRRRRRLLALPRRSARGFAGALLAVGSAVFLWAYLARAADLLLPALTLHGLALAFLVRGRAGARVVLLPALLPLLAVPIPSPLGDELVWRLQIWSARGAAWLMASAGLDVALGGIRFRFGDQSFAVIEACSGLRGIENLILVAVLVRELFASSGRRQWLLVLIAPFVGYGINVLRIVYIASSEDPQALADRAGHVWQGLAVMLVGTAVLYGLGWALAATARKPEPLPPSELPSHDDPWHGWRFAVLTLAGLLLVSLLLPPLPRAVAAPPTPIDFPMEREGWVGKEVDVDRYFLGSLPFRQFVSRRYDKTRQGRPDIVFVFIGREVPGNPLTSRLFTSKLSAPGAAFSIVTREPHRIWTLEADAHMAIAAASRVERVAVYHWTLRDAGLGWEILRSLLALDVGPFQRERPRTVVRLVSPIHRTDLSPRSRAKQTLDHFVLAFREELARL